MKWFAMLLTALAVIGFLVLAEAGVANLLSYTPRSLGNPLPGPLPQSPNGLPGFEYFWPVKKESLPKELPKTLLFQAQISETIQKDWELVQAQIYPVSPDKKADYDWMTPGEVAKQLGHPEKPFVIAFKDVTKSDNYRLRLIFMPCGNDAKMDLARIRTAPRAEREKSIAKLAPKYLAKAEGTIQEVRDCGGVRVSLAP